MTNFSACTPAFRSCLVYLQAYVIPTQEPHTFQPCWTSNTQGHHIHSQSGIKFKILRQWKPCLVYSQPWQLIALIRRRSDYIIGFIAPPISPNKSRKLKRLIAPAPNIRGKVWMKNSIHGFTEDNCLSVKCTGAIRRRSNYIIGFVTPAIGPNKFKKLTRLIAPVHNIRGKVWMKNNIRGFTDNKLIVCEAMCTVFHSNFAT